jgi:hypothetical protein
LFDTKLLIYTAAYKSENIEFFRTIWQQKNWCQNWCQVPLGRKRSNHQHFKDSFVKKQGQMLNIFDIYLKWNHVPFVSGNTKAYSKIAAE